MAVADFGDDVVAAHQRLLVVAGLRLRVGAVGDRAAVGRDQEKLALDAGLHLVAVLRGILDDALEHLARVLRRPACRPSTDRRRPRRPPASRAAGWRSRDRASRGCRDGPASCRARSRSRRSPRPAFAIASIAAAGTSLARMRAEQIDEGDQEIFDAVLLRVSSPDRSPSLSPLPTAVGIPNAAMSRSVLPVLPRNPVRAGKRHLRHRGGFDGERHEILRLQIVHMALAAGARDRLRFQRQHDR